MNKRKERTHHCGLTNVDVKAHQTYLGANGQPSEFYLNGIPRATSANNFRLTTKQSWQEPMKDNNPKYENTKQFYLSSGKLQRVQTTFATPRISLLEDARWIDRVFTGGPDNKSISVRPRPKSVQRKGLFLNHSNNQTSNASTAPPSAQKLFGVRHGSANVHWTKLDLNADAEQETQLVPIKNEETLAGKVDLNKVRDIRRAIRRRYASRSNYQKIFKQWDSLKQGFVDKYDICKMVNSLGIKINIDEAQVILYSADTNRDNKLFADEFIDLICSKNDKLNIDLHKLKKDEQIIDFNTDNQFVEEMRKETEETRALHERQKLNYFIQNSIHNISMWCLNQDAEKNYSLPVKEFTKILYTRLKLPESMKNQKNQIIIDDLVKPYIKEEQVNYHDFLKGMQNLDDKLNPLKQKPLTKIPGHWSTDSHGSGVQPSANDYQVLDQKRVPQNALEAIQKSALNVSRVLYKKFTQETFEEKVKQNLQPDQNGNILLPDLKKFFIEVCQEELKSKKLQKRDIEMTLSSFNFNKYGSMSVNDIAPSVFEDNITNRDHFVFRKRAMPPPFITIDNSKLSNKFDNPTDDNLAGAKKLFETIQDQFYLGSVKHLTVFKKFDRDNDGYVSHDDFKNALKRFDIKAPESAVNSALKVLDQDSKGYLDFRSFSQAFGPAMGKTIVPDSTPLEAYTNLKTNSLMDKKKQYMQSKSMRQFKLLVEPESHDYQSRATRFGNKPSSNTFLNYRSESTGGEPQTDRTKRAVHLNDKLSYQFEDKQKKREIQSAKLMKKQYNNIRIKEVSHRNDDRAFQLDQNRLFTKAVKNDIYERMSHNKII